MRLVVDASVAVKWLLIEDHSVEAIRLTRPGYTLLAPSLLWIEAIATLRKRLRRGQLSWEGFRNGLDDIESWDVTAHGVVPLGRPAADMAVTLDHAFYDCVYLALAERERCPVVTADRQLHAKVARSVFAGLTLWLGDLP